MDARLNHLFQENGYKSDLMHSCVCYQYSVSWNLTTGQISLHLPTDFTDAIY